MGIAYTFEHFLARNGVDYDIVGHPYTWSTLDAARSARIPGDFVAKAVMLEDDDGVLMAVLPATHRVELGLLHCQLDRELSMVSEERINDLFEDCEPGAIPPVGTAYGIETLVDDSLLDLPEVYLEAGDHQELIRLRAEQFRTLMADGKRGYFSHHI